LLIGSAGESYRNGISVVRELEIKYLTGSSLDFLSHLQTKFTLSFKDQKVELSARETGSVIILASLQGRSVLISYFCLRQFLFISQRGTFEALATLFPMVSHSQKECPDQIQVLCQESSHSCCRILAERL